MRITHDTEEDDTDYHKFGTVSRCWYRFGVEASPPPFAVGESFDLCIPEDTELERPDRNVLPRRSLPPLTSRLMKFAIGGCFV